MKNIIIDIISKNSGIDIHKLYDLVLQELEISNDPHNDETLLHHNKIDDLLKKIIKKDKISYKNGKYYLHDSNNDLNKRKYEENSNSQKKMKLEINESKLSELVHEEQDTDEPIIFKSGIKSKYYEDLWKNAEKYYKENTLPSDYINKNPDGITRLFCGNLNRKVTEDQLKQCIDGITHIKWITDKLTKEFYGSTFLEMKDAKAAITAVLQDGNKFMGRPLKIYYCPAKPGEIWPPTHKPSTLGHAIARKEKTAKPENGRKLFIGNLSYDIDDATMVDFFKDCGELIGLRWLENKDTGEFRVCL